MPPLNPVSHREFVKRLRILGFEGPFSGGKHLFMVRDENQLTIPNSHRGDIFVDLLSRLLKQAGISREEWESIK